MDFSVTSTEQGRIRTYNTLLDFSVTSTEHGRIRTYHTLRDFSVTTTEQGRVRTYDTLLDVSVTSTVSGRMTRSKSDLYQFQTQDTQSSVQMQSWLTVLHTTQPTANKTNKQSITSILLFQYLYLYRSSISVLRWWQSV